MTEQHDESFDLNQMADRWGIASSYHAFNGELRHVEPHVLNELLDAMGVFRENENENDSETDADLRNMDPHDDTSVVVLHPGDVFDGGIDWRLRLEDGGELSGSGILPTPLAPGYHELIREDGSTSLVISTPGQCFALKQRSWGWAVQLYALRSKRSWGMGDFDDLARFGELALSQGANMLMVNPLHAPSPGKHQEASPYFPSSREFRNPLFLAVDKIAGAEHLPEEVFAQARLLNETELIDRDAIWALKRSALEIIWSDLNLQAELSNNAAFVEFSEMQGTPLHLFATFCAISEIYGDDWRNWPEALRHPALSDVQRTAHELQERVLFFKWLQWLCDVQLTKASQVIGIVTDLAIGASPFGADSWIWQDVAMPGVTVGAPPDEFNTLGQNWALPASNPWKLRDIRFAPFVRMLRAAMSSGAGLRIDHVMGLFRLYCIPRDETARNGAFVSYPWRELLACVAIESQRNEAFVIGEDLGTVEAATRDALQSAGVLSYKLLWFENAGPEHFPEQSMAAITTHDLPTIVGLLSRSDIARQHLFGMEPDEAANDAIANKINHWLGRDVGFDLPSQRDEAVLEVTKLLAKANSSVRTMTLEDGLGLSDRPNYPGTTHEKWPNWSVPLPVYLDDLASHDLFMKSGRVMALGG